MGFERGVIVSEPAFESSLRFDLRCDILSRFAFRRGSGRLANDTNSYTTVIPAEGKE